MHVMSEESGLWIPDTEEEKELVRQQMNRLLETSHFKNSRRYPALFRFIVEETLDGRGAFLKERLLGIHVFDRPADYDTASDPIVRVTIAEIRKRIAQYYHEDAHEFEMRIELLPGRYEPEFRLGKDSRRQHPVVAAPVLPASSPAPRLRPENRPNHVLDAAPSAGVLHVSPETSPVATPQHRRSAIWWSAGLGVLAICLAAVVGGVFWQSAHPSALQELWAPVLASETPVTFCLPLAGKDPGLTPFTPDGSLKNRDADPHATDPSVDRSFLDHESLGENVVFSDTLALNKISTYLGARNHNARYRLTTRTTLDDLRQGPVVLIGGLDNQWTLRALDPLRFRFFGDEKQEFWIFDKQNPHKTDWGLNLELPYTSVRTDYAIIARIHDEATGQIDIIAAGVGMSGTAAAGEFLVDPRQAEELRRQVGSGFRNRDFEAVLSTDVVNGIAGSPRIIAVSVR